MGDVEQFVRNGIPTLDFHGPNETSSAIAFRALSYAARHCPLDPKAHHVFILITHEDPAVSQFQIFGIFFRAFPCR